MPFVILFLEERPCNAGMRQRERKNECVMFCAIRNRRLLDERSLDAKVPGATMFFFGFEK